MPCEGCTRGATPLRGSSANESRPFLNGCHCHTRGGGWREGVAGGGGADGGARDTWHLQILDLICFFSPWFLRKFYLLPLSGEPYSQVGMIQCRNSSCPTTSGAIVVPHLWSPQGSTCQEGNAKSKLMLGRPTVLLSGPVTGHRFITSPGLCAKVFS